MLTMVYAGQYSSNYYYSVLLFAGIPKCRMYNMCPEINRMHNHSSNFKHVRKVVLNWTEWPYSSSWSCCGLKITILGTMTESRKTDGTGQINIYNNI